jgi:hypothetical protein
MSVVSRREQGASRPRGGSGMCRRWPMRQRLDILGGVAVMGPPQDSMSHGTRKASMGKAHDTRQGNISHVPSGRVENLAWEWDMGWIELSGMETNNGNSSWRGYSACAENRFKWPLVCHPYIGIGYLAQKFGKVWLIKVDSYDIDKHKRDKYGYGCNIRTKTNL